MGELVGFYSEIKTILNRARKKAYATVNSCMVEAYWLIGKRIVEEEQKGKAKAGYGEKLIAGLSKALTAELGRGFSHANLLNFRQFYLAFPCQEIPYTVCRELSWSALRLIMRIENLNARNYYLEETRAQQWSVRQLQRNVSTHYYERLLSSRHRQQKLLKQSTFDKLSPHDFIKDPYVLEFLNIG